MKRCAIFAHYDCQNIIEEYVIYYLNELKKSIDDIIFVSDSELPQTELDKISNIVLHCIAKPHGEYDFGSYKRGFLYLKNNNSLKNYDELFFINDSCFGPLYPINEIFDKFANVDFWGMNSNNETANPNHIQSFFLAFKQKVFLSDIFNEFINSIKKENTKEDIIKNYEVGLSIKLINAGFTYDAVFKIPAPQKISGELFFINYPEPLLKTSVVKQCNSLLLNLILSKYTKSFNIKYPINFIKNYATNKCQNKPYKFVYTDFRRLFFRIHPKEKRFYFMRKWYHWDKKST